MDEPGNAVDGPVDLPPAAVNLVIASDAVLQARIRNVLYGTLAHVEHTLATGNPQRKDLVARGVVPHLIKALVHEEERDERYEELRVLVMQQNALIRAQLGGTSNVIEAESTESLPADLPPSHMDQSRGMDQSRRSHPSTQLRAVPDNGS